MDELRRQAVRLRDQLSTSQQRCNAVEAQLSLRDRQLVHKSEQLHLIETQVGTVAVVPGSSFALMHMHSV